MITYQAIQKKLHRIRKQLPEKHHFVIDTSLIAIAELLECEFCTCGAEKDGRLIENCNFCEANVREEHNGLLGCDFYLDANL